MPDINEKYVIPKIGKFKIDICQCPFCKLDLIKKDNFSVDYIVGFFKDKKKGWVSIFKCPVCWGRWYNKTGVNLYSIFEKRMNQGKNLFFK